MARRAADQLPKRAGLVNWKRIKNELKKAPIHKNDQIGLGSLFGVAGERVWHKTVSRRPSGGRHRDDLKTDSELIQKASHQNRFVSPVSSRDYRPETIDMIKRNAHFTVSLA